jgi:2-iminobutanoate/2-iminopropanoate deaminase
MEIIQGAEDAPAPVGAYSQAVKAGNLIFCAGQIGLDPATGKLVEGGVASQAERVVNNLRSVLAQAGSDWDHVAMTTIFLADINDAGVVNGVYSEVINTEAAPARQTVAVKDLPLGALVEISVIAQVRSL